jgi:cbb3-type cytochrome oxidase subunit 3
MRLSELVAHLTPSVFAQIALLIFVAVFVVMSYRALRRGTRTQSEQWAQLPLSDDATATSPESDRSSARAS